MDIEMIRGVVTVIVMCTFVGIVLWAWSDRRKQAFDAAARLPLEEDEEAGAGEAIRGGGRQ